MPRTELLRELMAWIADRTGYDAAKAAINTPEILFCQAGDRIAYDRQHLLVQPDDHGLYDPVLRRIYLVAPWSENSDWDVSILVHELVHHVQFSVRDWDCPNQAELQAYRLQDAWLAERGLTGDFDWAQITLQSRCPSEVHP